MKKRLIFIFVFVIVLILLTPVVIYNSNNPQIYKKINNYVENETFSGEEFSYNIENSTKTCITKYGGLNLCFYAKNKEDTYAVVSQDVNQYYLELTYGRDNIKIRLSGDTLQYWCRVDYNMVPIDIDDEVYYNKIMSCISQEKLYEVIACFDEYITLILKTYK